MKKSFCTLLFAAVVAFGTVTPLFADDEVEARRQAIVNGVEQLLKNTEEGLVKPVITDSFTKDGTSVTHIKFDIAPVTVTTVTNNITTTTTNNLGIKVWFSLEDGTCFNPIKRKMGVKERFYVHIQSAVPVYVSLFQNYPESRPESRQVYPDAKYPDTLKVIQAGVATKLPVPFEMDNDTRDEIMSMVVVRADAPQIQSTLTTQTTSSLVTTTGGVTTVTAQATASTAGTLKSINDQVVEKGKDSSEKFSIAAPSATANTTSSVPNDIIFYMLGTGYAGQWQLTLKK